MVTARKLPLYPDEKQIAEEVMPPGEKARWKGVATVLERDGLPRIDPVMGGRYWPAVRRFFDKRAGVEATLPQVEPGSMENWGCNTPKRTSRRASNGGSAKTETASRTGLREETS